jgi:hypothetical protein
MIHLLKALILIKILIFLIFSLVSYGTYNLIVDEITNSIINFKKIPIISKFNNLF